METSFASWEVAHDSTDLVQVLGLFVQVVRLFVQVVRLFVQVLGLLKQKSIGLDDGSEIRRAVTANQLRER